MGILPNGAAGVDTTNGFMLVSAGGTGDLSITDLPGQDQTTVRNAFAAKYVGAGSGSVFSDPSGPLAQLFSAIPGGAFGMAIINYLVTLILAIVGPIPILGTAFETLANFLGLTHSAATTAVTALAVAFDAESHGHVNTGSPTTYTLPHTTAVTENPAMIAYVAIGPLTPLAYAQGFVGVTYNGVELESRGGIDSGHGTDGWLEQFTLGGATTPASGLHNLVITCDAAVHSIAVSVKTYTGCSGFSGFVSAATSAEAQSLTVRSSTNGMVSTGMAAARSIASMTGTQRSVQNVDTATTAGNLIVGDAQGADSVTITATR